jgi:hypothetical protein
MDFGHSVTNSIIKEPLSTKIITNPITTARSTQYKAPTQKHPIKTNLKNTYHIQGSTDRDPSVSTAITTPPSAEQRANATLSSKKRRRESVSDAGSGNRQNIPSRPDPYDIETDSDTPLNTIRKRSVTALKPDISAVNGVSTKLKQAAAKNVHNGISKSSSPVLPPKSAAHESSKTITSTNGMNTARITPSRNDKTPANGQRAQSKHPEKSITSKTETDPQSEKRALLAEAA